MSDLTPKEHSKTVPWKKEANVATKAKRGPRKRRKHRFCIISCWQHCKQCKTYTTTYPNRRTALRAVPALGGDLSLLCINQYGGVHLAVPIAA